jgi:Tubulin/FtsZ family, GTPase domain
VGVYEAERTPGDRTSAPGYGDAVGDGWENHLRLGQDVRFVLVTVGGGAIRIGGEIARRHIRHLETVAINCDPKVQGFDDFDRRVYLGPDSGVETDTGGSPFVGGLLARAAEPALDRIFHGVTFVIVLGSLGGGAGSGAFPYVLEVACRNAEIVSAFVVKPFRCEGERRALADRAIGRLHFVESFVEKRQRGLASLQTLDNESLIGSQSRLPFHRVSEHWAALIENHIEKSFIAPAEAALDTLQFSRPLNVLPESELPRIEVPTIVVGPPAPPAPLDGPPVLPAASGGGSLEAELTFEIESSLPPPSAR